MHQSRHGLCAAGFCSLFQTGWIDEELEKAVVPLIPMGELVHPEDIAETILFLASEQAGMLTGQVIKVSGGHAF